MVDEAGGGMSYIRKNLSNVKLKYVQYGDARFTRVYPAKVRLFLKRLSTQDDLGLYCGSLNLVELLLGSIFTYTSRKTIPQMKMQLNTLVPLPYLSYRDENDTRKIKLFYLPHLVLNEAGYVGLSIVFDDDFVEELKKSVKRDLCSLTEIFKSTDDNYNLGTLIEENMECSTITNKVNDRGDDFIIDPKVLFKIFVQEHFSQWSLEIIDARNRGDIRKKMIRTSIIRHLRLSIPVDSLLVSQIGEQSSTSTSSSFYVKYYGINSFRLEDFYNKVYQRIEKIANNPSRNNEWSDYKIHQASIILGYLDYVNEVISKAISGNTGDNASKTKPVLTIDLNGFLDAIVAGFIELGVHGLSHLLTKYISYKLKVSTKHLGEIIILHAAPVHPEISRIMEYLGVVDGFLYRVSSDKWKADIIIYLRRDYSHPSLKASLNCDDDNKCNNALAEFNEFVNNILGEAPDDDRCYQRWVEKRMPARASLQVLSRALDNTSVCDGLSLGALMRSSMEKLSRLHGLADTSRLGPGELYKKVYLPLSTSRRYIYKTLLPDLVKSRRNTSRGAGKDKECTKEARRNLKHYVEQIYQASVPDCFDGCYNCILMDECGAPNPIIREWVVSKQAAKYILNHLNKQVNEAQ